MIVKDRISTESHYQQALSRAAQLMGALPHTPEIEELDELAASIEEYEDRMHSVGKPSKMGLRQHVLEAGADPKELAEMVATKT